jgi:hypothetical protein
MEGRDEVTLFRVKSVVPSSGEGKKGTADYNLITLVNYSTT